MNIIYRNIPLACLVATATAMSAETKLPVVEILGNQYYMYESKKGDSLFGIAREYGWDDKELSRLNPNVITPLKKGVKIYYPCDEKAAAATTVDPSTLVSEPVKHLVKRGETVYGISQLYNIPVETIYSLNPTSREGIKAGELLSLKKQDSGLSIGSNPAYYVIKRGDTLYGVAKKYNTSVAEILKLNPGISENNFKADDTIKLPASGSGLKRTTTTVKEPKIESFSTYQVEKNDTWETISTKTGVSKKDLMEANNTGSKPKKNDVIGVPQITMEEVEKVVIEEDPREKTRDGVVDIYEDVHGIADTNQSPEVKAAIVMADPSTRKDLDFTRGFLTGIDYLKNKDIKINLKVVDGSQTSTEVIDILGDFQPDIVFSTADKNTPSYLSDYATVSQTYVVNIFDLKNEYYTSNSHFIQLLTPSNYFNDEIASYIQKYYTGYNLIFAGATDAGDQLATLLKGKWSKSLITNVSTTSDLKEVTYWDSEKYVIYGNPTKKSEVSELLNTVKTVRNDNPNIEIVFIGRPSWIAFDESLSDQLHQADVLVPSRFYYDKSSFEARKFQSDYKSLFDMTPVKSYPMYAALGYDSSLYFLESFASTGGDINKFRTSTSSIQSNFSLERPTNWSGLINPLVYMVRFTPYDTIDKLEIK